MGYKLILIVLIFVYASTSPALGGEIYRWTDEEGVIHLVDDPGKVPPEYRESAKTIDTEDGDLTAQAKKLLIVITRNSLTVLTLLTIVILLLILIKSTSHFKGRRKKRKWDKIFEFYEHSGVERMDTADFKSFAAELLKHRGYEIDNLPDCVNPVTDFIAKKGDLKYAVHINTNANNVSRMIVNEIDREKARFDCDRSIVITRQFCEDQARKLGRAVGCTLVDRDTLARWIYDLRHKS
ncbi:MAG: restriction endonuclease [Deltaproteobacteria bacterium]